MFNHENRPARLFAYICVVLMTFSLAACGQEDSPPPAQPVADSSDDLDNGDSDNGDDDSDENSDDDDSEEDADDGEANEKPVATLAVGTDLSPQQVITVTFSEPMDGDSLEVAGTLAADINIEWQSPDTLELRATHCWPAGEQTLSLMASDMDGLAMDALEAQFDVAPAFTTFQSASVVIGQPDFTSGYPRQNPDAPSAAANTLDHPASAVDYAADSDLLFIGDTLSSRVLAFRGIPDVNNANAAFVVGQPDFSTTAGETSQEKIRRAQGISAQAGKLLIADPDSHRVTIYNHVPESWPAPADVVLGQENFEDFNNACAPHRFNHVHNQFVTPEGKLLVADANNNRVLVWNEIPEEIGTLPDLVLGQSRLDLCAANDDNQSGVTGPTEVPTARTLRHPTGIWSDGERLVIVDNYNHRVLLWHTFPQENFTPADVVLGQGNMHTAVPNDDDIDGETDAAPTARVVNYPWSTWFENNQLFVADADNNRVLVWNGWPEESFAPADVVLGQERFDAFAANGGTEAPTARTFDHPMGVRVVKDKLMITDTNNSRVLIFEAGR